MTEANNMGKIVLGLVPQQHPFRFIDDILEVDDEKIVGTCLFEEKSFFYQGHFPGNPITPGVILVESMAQAGVVGMGIFLMLQQGIGIEEIKAKSILFASAEKVAFDNIVLPGESVVVRGEKIYFRRNQLKSKVKVFKSNGLPVCRGILTGRSVDIHEK